MPTPINDVTVGGITATIAAIDFDYGLDPEPRRSVVYQLDDGDKGPKFCDALRGIGNYTGTIHQYPAPHRFPGNENLLCSSAKLHTLYDMAPGSQLMTSSACRILAEYSAPTWDALGYDLEEFWDVGAPIPWASVRTSYGHQEFVREGIELVGGGTTKRCKRRIPLVHYHVGRTMIPDLAAYNALIISLVGKLNDTPFCGFARGTVLFDGLEMDPQEERDPSGVRVYTFQTVCIYRPYDWNKELDTVANTFVFPNSTSDYAYSYGELNLLLRYGVV